LPSTAHAASAQLRVPRVGDDGREIDHAVKGVRAENPRLDLTSLLLRGGIPVCEALRGRQRAAVDPDSVGMRPVDDFPVRGDQRSDTDLGVRLEQEVRRKWWRGESTVVRKISR
jgi:hypothetical protein